MSLRENEERGERENERDLGFERQSCANSEYTWCKARVKYVYIF